MNTLVPNKDEQHDSHDEMDGITKRVDGKMSESKFSF